MKKWMIVLCFLAGSFGALKSQAFNTALGVRGTLGYPSITLKYARGNQSAAEFMLQANRYLVGLVVLAEKNYNFPNIRPLDWFVGIGAHFGYFRETVYKRNYYDISETGLYIGVDAIIGLELQLPDLPIWLTVDYKPAYSFITPWVEIQGAALGLRVSLDGF